MNSYHTPLLDHPRAQPTGRAGSGRARSVRSHPASERAGVRTYSGPVSLPLFVYLSRFLGSLKDQTGMTLAHVVRTCL
jgi:hypothetical protein